MSALFRGKVYGAVTVGERGQLVIPAQLRKALGIKSGDQLMVFSHPEKRIINLMPEKDFSEFLTKASQFIEELEKKAPKKH